jgi:hypothetical protein
LLGTLPGEYRLSFGVPGSQEFYIDCTDDSPCLASVFLEGFLPETVRVTVSAGVDEWTVVTTPEYVEVKPNGPRCDPTCQVGKVSLQVGS